MPVKTILVAPLNWGLGHATRCIPIIKALQTQGFEVVLASDGVALTLLRREFPTLRWVELPAYNVHYRTNNMIWNIGTQTHKILLAIATEWFALQRIIRTHGIDAVLSDNRYGCWSRRVPSIIMTHQVNIKMSVRWLERFINYFNRFQLLFFKTIWIPDLPDEPSLAGSLSHGFKLQNVRYVGVLSRLKPLKVGTRYDVGVVLSGPEPQRTLLETKLLQQIDDYHAHVNPSLSFFFVRGTTEGALPKERPNFEVHQFLTSEVLNQKMAASRLIIARSGYSTVMDLAALGKNAVLIPTPGQTEQEYLATNFLEQQIFYSETQAKFELKTALEKAQYFNGLRLEKRGEELLNAAIIEDFGKFATTLS